MAATRVFGEGEWSLVQTIAEGLEWSYGWAPASAHRLRFIIDFAYAPGLRAGELVGATLGMIEVDTEGDHWLHLVGKGGNWQGGAAAPGAIGARSLPGPTPLADDAHAMEFCDAAAWQP